MKRTRASAAIALFLVAAAAVSSRAGSYGTELPFTAGSGARASGMGLAVASVPGSPSLLYFNPALMARSQYDAFEFFRTTLFDSDAQFLAASYIHPTLDYGTVGASVLRVGVGGVEERDEFNNLLDDDLHNSQTRVILGYAADVRSMVSAGVNIKVDRQSFGDFAGTGLGADVGVLVHRGFSGYALLDEWRLGLAIENVIEPSVKLDQEDVADPTKVTVGASVDGHCRDLAFTTALDVVDRRYSPVTARVGQEVSYGGMFSLRVGVDGGTPTVGFGGRYRTLVLDYAYRDEDLGGNHRVSLSVALGGSRDQRKRERRERRDAELQSRVDQRMRAFEGSQLRAIVAGADTLFDAGSYERAMSQYEMALLWDPSLERAEERVRVCRRNLSVREADALAERGDYLGALHHLRQALLAVPDDKVVAARIADCEKQIDDARDRSRMIANRMNESIESYAQDQFIEARMGFAEVLRIDPGNTVAAEYERKCAASIDNAVRLAIARARDQAARGEFEAALATLERATRYRNDDPALRAEAAAIEDQRAAWASAAARTPKPAPTPVQPAVDSAALDARYARGLRAFEAGRFDDAARELAQVWSVAPSYRDALDLLTRAYLYLGMKAYSRGQYADAIEVWERILAVDPGNVKAIRYLEKSREEAEKLNGHTHD